MLMHLKGRWPGQSVPAGEPLWLFYEVEENTQVVTRIVEIFLDGSSLRNSIELAEREGPDLRAPQYRSLVHGDFLDDETRKWVEEISEAEFNRQWNCAADKPWP